MEIETINNDALGQWRNDFEAEYQLTEKVCASDERIFKFERTLTNVFVQSTFIEPAKPVQFRSNYLIGVDRPVVKVRKQFELKICLTPTGLNLDKLENKP